MYKMTYIMSWKLDQEFYMCKRERDIKIKNN